MTMMVSASTVDYFWRQASFNDALMADCGAPSNRLPSLIRVVGD